MAKNKVKKKFKTYTPQNGDTLDKIAAREKKAGNKVTARSIAKFNWGTDDDDTVQEKLRDELGCHQRGSDNKYVITADCKSGVLKIPIKYKLKKNQTNKFFKIKVKTKKKPPKQFIACAKVKGITFDSGESFIKPTVVETLKDLARELQKYPEGKVMIWGHVDDDEKKDDDPDHAKKLADNRAKAAHAFILNDVDTWMKLYNEEAWAAGVFRIILKDLGKNVDNPNTQAAIKRYQTAKGIGGNGSLTVQTKKELFKDYMTRHDVDLPGDVDKKRFMDPSYMGCSYFNMEGEPDEMNRRVMFYLFHKDRLPVLPCSLGDTFPCTRQMKPPKYRYKKTYNCSFYDSVARGCDRMAQEAAKKMAWVYLKLQYKDPEDQTKVRPFPKDMDVTVVFKDGSKEKVKTKDGGKLEFLVKTSKKEFTLHFRNKKARYVVVEPPGQAAKVELKGDKEIKQAIKDKHRLWRLPSRWSTKDSDWECSRNVYHDDNKGIWRIDTISTGDIGTQAAPAAYTLDPHWLYLRWEFLDRKFGHGATHNHKRVPMPAVLIAGMRKIRLSKVSRKKYKNPQTACLWGIKTADAAKACQAIPWIVSKYSKGKKKGQKLPDLDKQLVIEFGQRRLYVHSKTATDRVLVEINPKKAADKDKLKLTKDRFQYYDLPALWKSPNQYTRLSGGAAKLFGDLTTAEIKAAYSASKPLTFSLDDIALIKSNGKQDIRDQKKNGQGRKLANESRLTLLYLDANHATDKYKVRIHDHANEEFYSNTKFRSFTAGTKTIFVNLITDAHHDTRAIVFCGKFYHLYDKRTTGRSGFSFSKRQVIGARAAKHNDKDISGCAYMKWSQALQNKGYTTIGSFELHYLHLCEAKGDKVYAALVSYSSFLFWKGAGAVDQDITNYNTLGIRDTIRRWNNLKRYQFERAANTDKNIIVKPFMLFDAIMNNRGGKPRVKVKVINNPDFRSEMGSDSATFEHDAFSTGTFNCPADYDGLRAIYLTIAHELGHTSGLDDEYIEELEVTFSGDPDSTEFDVPTYKQYYPGMPAHNDERAMMVWNTLPRMHYWWGRLLWVNDSGQIKKKKKGPLYRFLEGTKFKVAYDPDPGNKDKLIYSLPDAHRVLWKPVKQQKRVKFGGNRYRNDLCLYKIGDDEYARKMPKLPAAALGVDVWSGILVVRTCISIRFRGAWTKAQRKAYMEAMEASI